MSELEIAVADFAKRRADLLNAPLASAPTLLHIDVRKVEELRTDGRIPYAKHVPLHLLSEHVLPASDKETTTVCPFH